MKASKKCPICRVKKSFEKFEDYKICKNCGLIVEKHKKGESEIEAPNAISQGQEREIVVMGNLD